MSTITIHVICAWCTWGALGKLFDYYFIEILTLLVIGSLQRISVYLEFASPSPCNSSLYGKLNTNCDTTENMNCRGDIIIEINKQSLLFMFLILTS